MQSLDPMARGESDEITAIPTVTKESSHGDVSGSGMLGPEVLLLPPATGLVGASGSEAQNKLQPICDRAEDRILQTLDDTRHPGTDGERPRVAHLGAPDCSGGDGVHLPRTRAWSRAQWPQPARPQGVQAAAWSRGPRPPTLRPRGPLGPVERPLPMCCVSSCTAGISLRGMWPVPPSLQQRRQHHADAAMAQLHSPAAPPAPDCFWVAGASQPAQLRLGGEAKPRLRQGPPAKKRVPPGREGRGGAGGMGGARCRAAEGGRGGRAGRCRELNGGTGLTDGGGRGQ